MDKQKVLNIVEESLAQLDKEIYENLILLAKSRGFSKKRNVSELLTMFEVKDYLIRMRDEYKDN